jgi:hypothetical protein
VSTAHHDRAALPSCTRHHVPSRTHKTIKTIATNLAPSRTAHFIQPLFCVVCMRVLFLFFSRSFLGCLLTYTLLWNGKVCIHLMPVICFSSRVCAQRRVPCRCGRRGPWVHGAAVSSRRFIPAHWQQVQDKLMPQILLLHPNKTGLLCWVGTLKMCGSLHLSCHHAHRSFMKTVRLVTKVFQGVLAFPGSLVYNDITVMCSCKGSGVLHVLKN